MDEALKQLLEVQDRDVRVHKLKQIIASVPVEKQKIEEELSGTESLVEQAKQAMMAVETKIKGIDLEIDSANNKIDDIRKKSVAVKKNEEYRALLSEIAQCEERISKLEDRQLEHWEELEVAKENRANAQKKLDASDSRIKAALKDLEIREQNCSGQIDKVTEERNRILGSIEGPLVDQYDRLSKINAKKGVFKPALVPLQGDNCGGCFLQVTPQTRNKLRGNKVVSCEQCGALLYFSV